MAAEAYRIVGNAIRFAVRLTPRGGRNAVESWATGADGKHYLRVRVSAPPEDGKANNALIALLAKHFEVAKSAVRIVSGETARLKLVEIEGNTGALIFRLAELDRMA